MHTRTQSEREEKGEREMEMEINREKAGKIIIFLVCEIWRQSEKIQKREERRIRKKH